MPVISNVPALYQEKVYHEKASSSSISNVVAESTKIVDFANMLLAKHEANMRQRE